MTSCRLLKSKNDAFCKICHLTTLTIKFLQGVLSTYYCTTLYDCHNSTDIFVNPYFFQFCTLKFGCYSWNSNCFWVFHDNILYRYLPKRPRCNTCLEFIPLKFQFPTFFENKNNCVGLETERVYFLQIKI